MGSSAVESTAWMKRVLILSHTSKNVGKTIPGVLDKMRSSSALYFSEELK